MPIDAILSHLLDNPKATTFIVIFCASVAVALLYLAFRHYILIMKVKEIEQDFHQLSEKISQTMDAEHAYYENQITQMNKLFDTIRTEFIAKIDSLDNKFQHLHSHIDNKVQGIYDHLLTKNIS